MAVGACRWPPSSSAASPPPSSGTELAQALGMKTKSLPVPVAQARNNFSDVVADAQKGRRIRLTRHGRPVSWIIGADERALLDQAQRGKSPRARRSSGR